MCVWLRLCCQCQDNGGLCDLNIHSDCAVFRNIHKVTQHAEQQLADQAPVSSDLRRLVGHLIVDMDSMLLGLVCQERNHAVQHFLYIGATLDLRQLRCFQAQEFHSVKRLVTSLSLWRVV